MLLPTEDAKIGSTPTDEVPMGRFGEIRELVHPMILLLGDGYYHIPAESSASTAVITPTALLSLPA